MRLTLPLVAATTLLLSAWAEPTLRSHPPEAPPAARPHKPAHLRIDGRRLVTDDGHEVRLRGVNIGGWLVTEAWMCGITDSRDTREAGESPGGAGRFTQETLEARFGEDRAKQLQDAWLDHWITAKDLDDIRDAGFNLIRVPISYRTLQHADGRWMLDAHGRIDFSRMDWIVAEAGRRGVYTVFDLHVWPEQRYDYEKIGRPEGEGIRRSMSRLWSTIAAHYRGDSAIAGFDLINEFPGAWGVQQQLSKAVEAGDPDRIQIVGGFALSDFLKLHHRGKFPNGVFSEHLYDAEPIAAAALSERLRQDEGSSVPVYIGEFLADDLPASARMMDFAGVSWSSWTFKTIDSGRWGLVNDPTHSRVDVEHEAFFEILAQWTRGMKSAERPMHVPGYPLDGRAPVSDGAI